METKNKQIIAIGGGGFSKYGEYSPLNLLIEEYILKQTGQKRPSICFIPTASGEAPKLDFVHFLDPSSERSFLQLNKFLGRGRNTPSCEIYYAAVCFSLEYESKKCTKSS